MAMKTLLHNEEFAKFRLLSVVGRCIVCAAISISLLSERYDATGLSVISTLH